MSVEQSKLANGLTVVSHAMPEVETVSLGIWIGAGSRSEASGEHGIAHFLEHMAFKGTARRSAREIAEEIEAVGGDLNAATGVDSTAYYARVLRKDLPLALDILSDIILSPRFDRNELARERDVILQEIARGLGLARGHRLRPGAGRGLPRPARRPVDPRHGGKRQPLQARPSRHLSVGALSWSQHGARRRRRRRSCGADRKRPSAGLAASPSIPAPEPERARYSGGVRRSEKSLRADPCRARLRGRAYRHADYFTAQICAGALGGGMSSRLFQEVRERRGLCYAIYAFASGLSDSGMFTIHAAGGPDRAHELFAVIRDELVRAADEGFRADEIARVKAQLKMGLLTGLESSSARAEQLARQILIYGRPLSTEELIEKVEKVEAADLQALVARMLASPLSLATVGPILHVARFDRVAEKFAVPSTKAA